MKNFGFFKLLYYQRNMFFFTKCLTVYIANTGLAEYKRNKYNYDI